MDEAEDATKNANEELVPLVSPALMDSLHELASELVRVKARAQELGLFVGDRPLHKCPHCHLMEDVTAGGFLIVYPAHQIATEFSEMSDRAGQVPQVTQSWDTGLRFAELSEERVLCPACGCVFPPEPEPEIEMELPGLSDELGEPSSETKTLEDAAETDRSADHGNP